MDMYRLEVSTYYKLEPLSLRECIFCKQLSSKTQKLFYDFTFVIIVTTKNIINSVNITINLANCVGKL